jgi:hypothetical protein
MILLNLDALNAGQTEAIRAAQQRIETLERLLARLRDFGTARDSALWRGEIDAALAGFVPSKAFLHGASPQSAWPFAQHDHTGYLEYASWDMAAIRKEAKP